MVTDMDTVVVMEVDMTMVNDRERGSLDFTEDSRCNGYGDGSGYGYGNGYVVLHGNGYGSGKGISYGNGYAYIGGDGKGYDYS